MALSFSSDFISGNYTCGEKESTQPKGLLNIDLSKHLSTFFKQDLDKRNILK